MAGCGVTYLARRNLPWDHGYQAAAELGWLSCGLTLATGSLWAHEAWGTWWVWDPRLTTSLISGSSTPGSADSGGPGQPTPADPRRCDPGRAGRRRYPAGRHGHAVVSRDAPRGTADGAVMRQYARGQCFGVYRLVVWLATFRRRQLRLSQNLDALRRLAEDGSKSLTLSPASAVCKACRLGLPSRPLGTESQATRDRAPGYFGCNLAA